MQSKTRSNTRRIPQRLHFKIKGGFLLFSFPTLHNTCYVPDALPGRVLHCYKHKLQVKPGFKSQLHPPAGALGTMPPGLSFPSYKMGTIFLTGCLIGFNEAKNTAYLVCGSRLPNLGTADTGTDGSVARLCPGHCRVPRSIPASTH